MNSEGSSRKFSALLNFTFLPMHHVVNTLFVRSGIMFKGSVSSSIPCTCRYLTGLCLSPFSWAMKMATTKEKQETTRARHAG